MNRATIRTFTTAFAAAAAITLASATAATALTPAPGGTHDTNTYNNGTADPGTSTSPSPTAQKPKITHLSSSSYTDADCVDTYKAYEQARDEQAKAAMAGDSVAEAYWYGRMKARWHEFSQNCTYTP